MKRVNPVSTERARELRSDMTVVEHKLWQAIRGEQIDGCKFRRQYVIGKYIADFACVAQKLVIELDGGQHQDQVGYDDHRTAYLQQQGWRVLRFWNNDVMENMEGVLAGIALALAAAPPS
ncbi:MAG: DUF559 domain-containing protein [Burkholderiales bacterium]|nr:DUF559 domain-containing protein [Burkholderiales bacterium]